MHLLLLTLALGLPALVHGRTFVVANNCPFTVWPALYTDFKVGQAVPNSPTGWQADAYTSVSFTVPDNWKAGRIWARRDCNFATTNDVNSCLSGGCNGGLLCDAMTGTGVPPATLAEWTLQGDGNRDFYDVSLVDGYNIPMRIDNSAGCPVADCLVDLGPGCPAALQGPYDASGYALGCKSACEIDPNPQDSANCCSGSHNTAATCPPANVQYYDYFKGNCPNAYAYAYDESSGTALWTCDSGLAADYTLTFCPSASNGSSSAVPAASSAISGIASTVVPGAGTTVVGAGASASNISTAAASTPVPGGQVSANATTSSLSTTIATMTSSTSLSTPTSSAVRIHYRLTISLMIPTLLVLWM